MPVDAPDTRPGPAPSDVRRRLALARRRVRRAVLGRRRLLAAVCAALAVAAGVRAVAAPPPARVAVTVAARDLPAGAVLASTDLTTVELPPEARPDGLLTDPTGRTLAGPVTQGEALTEVRVVGAPMAREALAGTERLALPVRLPDAGAVGLLQVGDRIDLVATDPQGATSEVVAQGVPVLALPGPDSSAGAAGPAGPAGGRLVVVGVAADELAQVSTAAAATFLTYAWSR